MRVSLYIFFVFISFNYPLIAAENYYLGPDFTASKTTSEQGRRLVSRVYVSQLGYREEVRPNGRDQVIYLTDFKTGQTWMMVPAKTIYVEIESMMGGAQGGFNQTTLFNPKPCIGFDVSRKIRNRRENNIKYVEWNCLNTFTNKQITQWYSPDHGMVTREFRRGISEIIARNIVMGDLSKALFKIPEEYLKGELSDVLNVLR